MNNTYLITKFSDIDYQKILNDYRINFDGKIASITTNYKLLKKFDVNFDETYLPHRMAKSYR